MGVNVLGGVKHVMNSVLENTGEGLLSKTVRKAGEVLDDLSAGGSEIAGKLRGNFEQAKSVTNTLKLDTEGGYNHATNYYNQLDKQFKHVNDSLESIGKSGVTNESIIKREGILKSQRDALQGEIDRVKGAIRTDAQGNIGAYDANALKGKTLDFTSEPGSAAKFKNLGENIKNYYTEGDAGALATRAGVTAGVYGAGAVGLRYASGGNLTTNSNGESDIAGIPFI
jgi:hypothetical protein